MKSKEMMSKLKRKKDNSKVEKLKNADIKIKTNNLRSLEIRKILSKNNCQNLEPKNNNKIEK